MAANWIIALTSFEQWRSEKEGRKRKRSTVCWVRLVSCTVGPAGKSRPIKNA